jgi:hypothetical protein
MDHDRYWTEPPPEPSPKLKYWVDKFEEGWRPNRRIQRMGRDACSEFYDVYQWEYFHCILPLADAVLAQNCGYEHRLWDGFSWVLPGGRNV